MHTEPLLIVIFLRYLLEPPPDLLDPLLRRVSHDDGTCLSSASTEDLLAGRNDKQRQHWLQPRHYSFTTSSSLSPSPAKSFVVSENENESKDNNNSEVNVAVAEQQFESNSSNNRAKKFNGPATSFAINENTVNINLTNFILSQNPHND